MKAVIIDSNLLLLAIVGSLRQDLVGKHRRLREFRKADYSLLQSEISEFQKFFTLPNVITEVSNLIGSGKQEICNGACESLAQFVSSADEVYRASKDVVSLPQFFRLGLTDAALLHVSQTGTTTITTDRHLAGVLESLGLPCINFNHKRTP